MIAAVSPTIMYRTRRALSSSRNRRSASLSAETIKDESLSQPLFDRATEVPQHMVDAGDVHSRMRGGDPFGTPPQLPAQLRPPALFFGHAGRLGEHDHSGR